MSTHVRHAAALPFVLALFASACGDVYADAVTLPGQSGSAGLGGNASAGAAGSSVGGAGTGGSDGSGGSAGTAGSGGSGGSGGSNSGGSGANSGEGNPCESSQDCTSGDQRICDLGRLRCVECVMDAHCEDVGEGCHPVLGECATRCDGVAPCPESDDPICDTSIGFCVECQVDTDCDGDELCRSSQCTN